MENGSQGEAGANRDAWLIVLAAAMVAAAILASIAHDFGILRP